MNSGNLDQRINIERHSTGTDALGQPVETWELVAAVWANIKNQSGLSAIKAESDVSVVKTSIRIRHRTVDAGMRVVHGADIYDIRAVLPDGKKQYVDLVCQKVA